MARIEGFRIRNFGALRDITLGKLLGEYEQSPTLEPLTVVIGKNGAGKSTLFDAFGFLAECMKTSVEKACDKRGGFNRIVSQGAGEPIMFEIYYREGHHSRPITYEASFALDKNSRPYVKRECLRQRRHGQKRGAPFSFLYLEDGQGWVWKGESAVSKSSDDSMESLKEEESGEKEFVKLPDNRELGIATLGGALERHPRIAAFREFIKSWYLSYFTPDAARGLPLAGPQPQLNLHGDNLGNVVQFMERDHPKQFAKILEDIASKIPGIKKISTKLTDDGRLLLQFNDKGFSDPFYAQQMSDGTLKLFAYLLLLSNPNPPPFLCLEEPENGLHHKLLETLVKQLRAYTTENKSKSQAFITTHQPYFVSALNPEEVWILEKSEDGFSKIRRASDDPLVNSLVSEGLPLGGLWYSDYLEGV